ncbi:MAG: putative ABC transport system permease protein [Mariniblastus sp.]|jgi:putative ABC transport system permease protein
MQNLDRKLIRDLTHMKGQILAIVMVIAAGIAVFTMAMCAYSSLKNGQNKFYREFRFADIFSNARRCPNAMIPRIEDLTGVSTVETRLVYEVLLDVPGMVEPATAKLISFPESGENKLNQVYISRGRMLEPNRNGEVVVSEMFADAHGLVPGEQLKAIINGKLQSLKIVGIALSPEFVIQVQGGSMLPDKKRYAIFWMNQRELESAFDMTGAFNNVSLKLAYGANSRELIEQLDNLLEPYGSFGAYDRSENVSHQFVEDELIQLRTMATIAPAIFLSVAAFLLNIVITRIITKQREQIAALKAFGYSNYEVGFHYLNLVLIIAISGMLVGTLLGVWMATRLTEMYQEFYKFPLLTTQVDQAAILYALLLTTVVALLGTWLAVRKAIALPPAEAMRPEPPPTFRPTILEKILPTQLLPAALRMVIRNVQRKPFKSAASSIGIAMSVAVLIVGAFSLDSLDYLIDFQFRKAQRQDLTVGFIEPATASVVYELSNLDGVLDSETMRVVPSRMHFQHRSRRIGITGLEPDADLFRLLNAKEQVVQIPEHGVMLNSKVAEVLGCQKGDLVRVEILEAERPTVEMEVTAIVDEFGGMNAYMEKSRVHEMLNESAVASGAFLKVDANRLDDIYQELESRPGIGSVSIKNAAIKSFMETIADNMLTMRAFNIMFAIVIAIGVVYNSAQISLSEQSRDLATMRVIGFTRQEVSMVLLGEIGLFTVLAIPLGCAIGYGLAWALIQGLATENYRIPLVIDNSTFAFACSIVLAATFCSGLIVQRRISDLDLVSALKTRE